MKKVVIITGASSGIGLATARYLSGKNFKVYGIARNEFETKDFQFVKGDVTRHEEMASIVKDIYEKESHIDVLINNAGMGISGPIEETKKIDVERIFNLNVIALIDMCSIVLPYLRQSKGKIVNISSVAAPIAIPFQACYSATKTAVEKFSLALRNEVKPFGVKVCCVRPGDTKTGFTKARVKEEQNTNSVYYKRSTKSVTKMEKDEQNGMNALCVSKLVCKVINRKNPPLISTVGFGYKSLCLLERILPTRFVNFLVGKIYG